MIDVQSMPDPHKIRINRVGVTDLHYPIMVLEKDGGRQKTIADIQVAVDLSPEYRGTHMSRFIEVVDKYCGEELTAFTIPKILNEIRGHLDSKTAEIDIRFPYFLRKNAPVSGRSGMVDYRCHFHGRLDGEVDFQYGITAPVTSVCPCSKEISDRGAHNQRSMVTVEVRSGKDEIIWFEELIEWIEECSSAPVYSILKREDEKYITERAFDNPTFVEDIARSLAHKLNMEQRVIWYRVHAENFESIHNHNAFASIECEK